MLYLVLFLKTWTLLQRSWGLTVHKYLLYVLMIKTMGKLQTIYAHILHIQKNYGKVSFSHVFTIHNLEALPLTWDAYKARGEKSFIVWWQAVSLGVDSIHRHVWTGTFHVVRSILNHLAKLAVGQPARTKHNSHCSFNNVSKMFRLF